VKIAQGTGVPIDADLPSLETPDGRAEAERRSQGCRYCGGQGMTLVDAAGNDAKVKTVSATCVCLHGRWIRAWHQAKNSAILARIPDLSRILNGTDRRWRFNSGDIEECPVPTRRDINAMFRSKSVGGVA
jgi:hypothetical protein